jgi:hypothetical protein
MATNTSTVLDCCRLYAVLRDVNPESPAFVRLAKERVDHHRSEGNKTWTNAWVSLIREGLQEDEDVDAHV